MKIFYDTPNSGFSTIFNTDEIATHSAVSKKCAEQPELRQKIYDVLLEAHQKIQGVLLEHDIATKEID